MQYIVFPSGEQKKFLRGAKEKSGKSWEALSCELGKSKKMIFFYLREECKMSLETYEKLNAYVNEKRDLKVIDMKNTFVDCVLPEKMSEGLAEFLGALAGDGHMGVKYQVCFAVSNLVDKEYSLHIQQLFKDLFNIDATMYVQMNCRKVKTYSKKLLNFLHNEYGHPIGKKKHRLHIPIFEDNKFLLAYLRGLFDTDGSFYERGSGRGVVNICSLDSIHMQEVAEALRRNGFHVCVSGKGLYIYRRQDIRRFFEEVNPSNIKHRRKYDLFISRLEKGRYV
jgi:hypothetical protein